MTADDTYVAAPPTEENKKLFSKEEKPKIEDSIAAIASATARRRRCFLRNFNCSISRYASTVVQPGLFPTSVPPIVW